MPIINMSDLLILDTFGIIQVSGPDAAKFLQGQITCNVNEIDSNKGTMGAHCNPQGRIISLFYLTKSNDQFFLVLPNTMIEIALTALKKYAVFFKVTINDASHEYAIIVDNDHSIKTNALAIIQLPPDSKRLLIILPLTKISHLTTTTFSEQDWHCTNLAKNLPMIYPETSGRFLPHELNLPGLNAISFNKGCYTGQEIIARMHYRAKTKTRLIHLDVNLLQFPLLGSDIFNADTKKACGTLVDICQLENQFYRLLIVIANSITSDQTLFLANNEGSFFSIME